MGSHSQARGGAGVTFEVNLHGQTRVLVLTATNGGWEVELDGHALPADAVRIDTHTLSLLLKGRSYTFAWEREPGGGGIWLGSPNRGLQAVASVADPRQLRANHSFEQSGRAPIKAPMAGKVVKLLTETGAAVERGQGVVVLEAMKMQNEVRSPKSGTVVKLAVAAGEAVATGQVLAEIE